jgi:hypothetical protein
MTTIHSPPTVPRRLIPTCLSRVLQPLLPRVPARGGSGSGCRRPKLLVPPRLLRSYGGVSFAKPCSLLASLALGGVTSLAVIQAASASTANADYNVRWGVKIPMRDGVELNTTLYLPKEKQAPARTPVIFTLTHYLSDVFLEGGAYFAAHGYTFSLVDVRGRGNSGG